MFVKREYNAALMEARKTKGSTGMAEHHAVTNMVVDKLRVSIYRDTTALAEHAAAELAPLIAASIATRGYASVIVATGNSQLAFMRALRERDDIDWSHVYVFHMDEYPGLGPDHPASFRRYIRENLTDIVEPREFFGMDGDASNVDDEIERYTDLLARYPPDITVMGIGENGHLAFNDPPADFHTTATVLWVTLDDACRRQQAGEGHFPCVDDVPELAFSLSIPALLRSREVFVIVPEQRKAEAVKAALEGPVTPDCPASILQQQSHARLFLDQESASLLAARRIDASS